MHLRSLSDVPEQGTPSWGAPDLPFAFAYLVVAALSLRISWNLLLCLG